MKRQYSHLKNKAIALRKKGKTYGEIRNTLKMPLPKSTLSLWFKDIKLSNRQKINLRENIKNKIIQGQIKAHKQIKEQRRKYLQEVEGRVIHLKIAMENKDAAKIALAMLYLGEGFKHRKGSMAFGNSDPGTIKLFMKLMRRCYEIDESKFRCTLQCRADQNIRKLEKFWSEVTDIPPNKFYGARIDPRTIGIPTKKLEYKGVCKIDYFSADIYNELIKISEVLTS